ncbi:hypothetical protein QR680_011497 [Steinernema hermaphroditum]|uniref:Uncharacterized protein n=1 Tax=Steinernema hermaphroditum TaxID=289476 RepID=A0AA39HYQ2_9BILA|nr:hypothetical protein QR680_011497 [Steinernema hermaphroditum]
MGADLKKDDISMTLSWPPSLDYSCGISGTSFPNYSKELEARRVRNPCPIRVPTMFKQFISLRNNHIVLCYTL